MKLSYIIPVYNVEKYLRKCVESLIKQDYDSYELILVDDGSTDGSGELCDEFARELKIEDRRLKNIQLRVIHQSNGGLSAARNAGLKVAKGEYVCFVDSDDYWEENVLGGLMAQVKRDNLDVLRYNYQNVNEQYEVFNPNKAQKRDVDYSDTITDGETFLNKRLGPMCYAVMFVIRRALLFNDWTLDIRNWKLNEGDCLFKEGIYFEDVDWTPRMLLRAKRVASTPMIVYNYLWRSGSITLPTDSKKREKVLKDKISLLYGFRDQSKLVEDKTWYEWMTSNVTMGVLNMLAALPVVERNYYMKELKGLRVFPLLTKKEKMLSHRIKIMLANISPSLYCTLMSLRK